jgi:hypothetical protein
MVIGVALDLYLSTVRVLDMYRCSWLDLALDAFVVILSVVVPHARSWYRPSGNLA